MKINYFFLQILIFALSVVAPQLEGNALEVYRKKVRLELNPVPGATAYELEVTSSAITETYKLVTPQWSGDLEPGHYKIRMRSLDKRNIRGEWSAFQDIEVPPNYPTPATDLRNPPRTFVKCERVCVTLGYRVNSVNYESYNYDKSLASNSQFSALGGSGHIGLLHEKGSKNWGYKGAFNYSFVRTDSSFNPIYVSLDTSLFRRIPIISGYSLLFQAGLFYKEDPVLIGDATTFLILDSSQVAAAGPWLGLKYEMQMANGISAWMFAHLYNGVVRIKTPNKQQMNSSTLSQIGVMISHTFNSSWKVTMGPLISDSNVAYGADAGGSGKTNSARVQSRSFNIDLEYSF